MLLGEVLGFATATTKHASLQGWRLAIVQPLLADGQSADGKPLLVIDPYSSRRGDRVLLSSDSKEARSVLKSRNTPVRWSVVGIRDS